MPDVNNGFLYNLMVSPRYRIFRHILLLIGLIIVSLNQAYSTYREHLLGLGNNIYIIALVITCLYAVVIYYNLYILVPRYLVNKKYLYYVIGMVFSVFVLLLLQDFLEYIIHIVYKMPPGEVSLFNPENSLFIDTITSFATYGVCIAGVSVTALLKQWMIEDQRISKLENEHVKSEVEQLKNQVTPSFLFNILNRTGVLAKSEPAKASEMLMRLSQILRYQLYDSSRGKVVLNSEIEFIKSYLNLQQLYYGNLEYKIQVEGSVSRILLPPLLFIPFVQYSIDRMPDKEKAYPVVNISFKVEEKFLCFICYSDKETSLDDSALNNIKRRLTLLFPHKHTLKFDKQRNEIILKLALNED